ncbi:D-2-hydroxyacid dehydrogenase [Alteromonas halophila]|uniref:Glycerate dehydrogenase n=1 Tax=Alteromonas halophila TaxID=516698 RepID=A0A918N0V1_9ALTE|nr:D-2-hydroxyacid dehydrogenase [Alteromonas halophila]GGW91384.1 glycerate dehydrogenase [Alteromonas halophila]
MMRAVFLDAGSLGLSDLDTAQLDALAIDLTCYETTRPDQVQARVKDATVILTNKVVLDETVLSQASHCKYIGITATGMNNVDLTVCERRGITVRNVAGYGTDAVAQHTLMLLLNLAARFVDYYQDVRAGKWSQSPHFCRLDHPVTELAGKHAVIVGHGALGQRVEQLFAALGMQVSIAARPGNADDPRPPLKDLLPDADVLSLHCQLSEHTRAMVNAALLAKVKPGCLLINTARGGLIDEAALLDALDSGRLGGAALDVLSQEPPPEDHPLLQYDKPNLLITPHNAWVATASRQRLLNSVVSQLSDFIAQPQ